MTVMAEQSRAATPKLRAGERFQFAVFGFSGPLSGARPNIVWFREAKVEFYG